MSNTTIIVVAVILVFIALLAFKLLHHHGVHNDVESLKKVCAEIFASFGKDQIPSQEFIQALKEKTGISQKAALTLFGKARQEGIIKVENRIVELG